MNDAQRRRSTHRVMEWTAYRYVYGVHVHLRRSTFGGGGGNLTCNKVAYVDVRVNWKLVTQRR